MLFGPESVFIAGSDFSPRVAVFLWLLFISVAAVLIGMQVLSFKNEKIELTSENLIWTGPTGRVKAEIPLKSLRPGSLQSSSWGFEGQHKFTVTTPEGKIKFNSELNDFEILANRLIERCDGIELTSPLMVPLGPGVNLHCKYTVGKWPSAILAGFVLFCLIGLWVTSNWGPMRSSDGPQLIVCVLILGGVVLYMAYWVSQQSKLESIVLRSDRLTWIDHRGELCADVYLREIIPGSFQDRIYGKRRIQYQVSTVAGDVKWDGHINNCYELTVILQLAALGVSQKTDAEQQASAHAYLMQNTISE